MSQTKYQDGTIHTSQLPHGDWMASWTGPDGKGFGRIAPTEQSALDQLHGALQHPAEGETLEAEEFSTPAAPEFASAPVFERFCINTEERANWYLRSLATKEAERARVKAQADAMLKELDADITRFRARFEMELADYVRDQLAARGSKKKSLVLLQGTCAFRTSPASLRIAAPAEALEFAKGQGWDVIRTTESLDTDGYKRQALAQLQETGEVLPGMESVPERESFSIKFGGKDTE